MGNTAADLGYIGVSGIGTVPFKRVSGWNLLDWQREFNRACSKISAAVERAVARVKAWRMLSEEGRRYRCPLENTRTCWPLHRTVFLRQIQQRLMNKPPGVLRVTCDALGKVGHPRHPKPGDVLREAYQSLKDTKARWTSYKLRMQYERGHAAKAADGGEFF